MNKPSNHSGFSLLEILVAIVTVAISAMGVAVLQIKALQFNHSAYSETQVILLARDMSERMRANPAAMAAGNYHLPKAIKHENCFTAIGCDSAEMAENDMYEWAGAHERSSIKLLAKGSGIVCLDSTPNDGTETDSGCDGAGNTYAIKIWRLNLDKEITRTVITSNYNY